MHTGDGIARAEVSADALLAPSGGEGGSVLQALGSQEVRKQRRDKKKQDYAKYLEGPVWKKIRARALRRDKYLCRACGGKAVHVHHRRYPKNLGEEQMDWLYSLCVPCHNSIHKAATSMTLRAATDLILGATRNGKVTRLPDARPPAGNRARWTKKPSRTPKKKKPKKLKKIKPFEIKAGGPRLGTGTSKPSRRKRLPLQQANDELHAIQKRNRERREERRRNGA